MSSKKGGKLYLARAGYTSGPLFRDLGSRVQPGLVLLLHQPGSDISAVINLVTCRNSR